MRMAREIAKITGFSYRTILKACKSGQIESFQPAERGPIYITDSAWEGYLQSIKTKARIPGRIGSANPNGKSLEVEKFALK